ncbi:MAG: hypothetical protein ACTSR8_05790 [Promethearchaeota archaeon]
MADPFETFWLILEWIIFILMIGPVTVFFYSKYRKDKRNAIQSSATFNLGYMIFFILTSLNQLIYIIDAINAYSEAIGWNAILTTGIKNTILFEFTLKSQITIMLCLFFFSFVVIMYPIEKHIRKSERFPISIFLLIGGATSGIIWVIFCLLQVPQPIELIWLQIIVAAILIISVSALFVSIIAFLYFYLKVAINSVGAVRKKALIVTFGIFFMYFSLIGGNLTKPDVAGTIFILIGPIFLILGIMILIYGFKIEGT